MKFSYRNVAAFFAALIAGSFLFPSRTSAAVNDVSAAVEWLGNPVNDIYPGKALGSMHDLQWFDGKIFLGYGTLNNVVAKMPLYLDPITRQFHADKPGTTLNDEILRRFRVFGNEMYVESFDPISNLSNLYVRDASGWRISGMDFPGSGRHNFDIYKFGNVLFTGGGLGFPGIAMSLNGGAGWILPGADITNAVFYESEFFEFNGQLYVSQDLSYSKFFTNVAAPFLMKYTGGTNAPFVTVYDSPAEYYPGGDLNEGKVSHFQNWGGQGAFIGNGGIYVVTSMEPATVTKATLPNALGDFAVDLIVRSNGVYFLACQPQPSNGEFPFLGIIGKSEDLKTWVEICRFGAREVVQSFERVNDDFFVGLGNHMTAANPHSGDVLRIPGLVANEERSVVVPSNLEFANGRAGNNFPFGLGSSVRYQQVYAASSFSAISGPQLITHVAFRPSAFSGQAFTNTVQNLRVDFSTTGASPLTGLASQFALNIGSDVTTVFTGPITFSSSYAGSDGGPKSFDVVIPLQTPFFYDPAKGNLLMDIRNFSGSSCTPLDLTWGTGLPSSRMSSASGGVANAVGVADAAPTCLITKFRMVPATLTNRAPLVFAGPAQSVTWPDKAQLNGTASDDGLPDPPATVTNGWIKVSGPGTVTFSNSRSAQTLAEFSQVGVYVLRLCSGDGALSASSDVTVTVLPPAPANLAPVVHAGHDQTMTRTNRSSGVTNAVSLNGLIADDGYPQPPGVTTSLWSKVNGPGTVAFENPSAPVTRAQFSSSGNYVLRLTANDGQLSASHEVSIFVKEASGINQVPTVNAGPDLTTTQIKPVNLNASITDDGLPLAAVGSVVWSKVSGPGSVQFGDVNKAVTTAAFSLSGNYVLRLTASDGDLQSSDDVRVHVLEGTFVVVPNSLSNAVGRAGNSYPLNIPESVRYQQVYAASQFPSNSGPFLITEVAFRPSMSSGGPFTSAIPNVVIELSTTAANPGSGLSATFADNIGPDKQTVFAGRLMLSSKCIGTGPREFDVILPLQRAFYYDPRKGNLLLDIRNISGGLSTFLDLTWGTGTPSSRMVSRVGGVNDLQGSGDTSPTALATRFVIGRVPPPTMTIGNGGNPYALQIQSVFGQRVVVESSNDLVNWTAVSTNLPLQEVMDLGSSSNLQPQQFYRSHIAP